MNETFFLGYPVEFKGICYITPPTVKDVAANKKFPIYMKILTLSQEEIEDDYNENGLDLNELLNPFEYILNNAYHNNEFRQLLQEAFYAFTKEEVKFLYEQKMIVIGDFSAAKTLEDLRILREEDYFEFQNLIRQSLGDKAISPPDPNEDPRVRRIKAKARYREKVKAKKGMGLKMSTTLASICCMNMGINPLNIGELSYAAIPLLIATYQEKEKYQLDIDSLLAGADSKKIKPKYWIRNIED